MKKIYGFLAFFFLGMPALFWNFFATNEIRYEYEEFRFIFGLIFSLIGILFIYMWEKCPSQPT